MRPKIYSGISEINDSPVESERKTLPRGNGAWKGYAHVYSKLKEACMSIAKNPYLLQGEEHISMMAILGSGNEELMKYEMARCYSRGFINY